MTDSAHLIVAPIDDRETDGEWVRSAEVRTPGKDPRLLVFRVPVEHRDLVTESADPFLLLALFPAMEAGLPLQIRGRVSADLLQNLDEFQTAWAYWRSEYTKVEIVADVVAEASGPEGEGALACFSGGLDSTFTIWRHHHGQPGNGTRQIRAGMFVRGFDIPLGEEDAWKRAFRAAEECLRPLGLPVIPVTCNVRDFGGHWPMTHGAALAGCLHLLRRGFAEGIIAASQAYDSLRLPWGTNPVTDPLLSTRSLRIYNDGAGYTRPAKSAVLSTWTEALRRLRPCWRGPDYASNCGRCFNCIVTGMGWIARGEVPPEVLHLKDLPARIAAIPEEEFSLIRCRRIRLLSIDPARKAGIQDPAIDAMERRVHRALRRFERRAWLENLNYGTRRMMKQLLGLRPRG